MDSQDELLAKLRAIDAETQPSPAVELKPVSPPPQAASPATSPRSAASKAELLAQLDALDRATRTAQPVIAPPLPQAMAQPPRQSQPPRQPQSQGQPSPQQLPWQPFPNVMERLKQFTQAQLAAHAAENRAKAERAQAIARAEAWLAALDPLSDDGFWFEQFAEGYASRLEAALVFLDPAKGQVS